MRPTLALRRSARSPVDVSPVTPEIPPAPRGAEAFGAWWDETTAQAACAFFETRLRHTEAEWAGQPFVLQPWQREIVRALFGWKREDGTRLYRTLYLEVPRKNGKTEFAAGIALLALTGDREKGGQVYALAVGEDQARIPFNKAGVMIGQDAELSAEIEVYKTSIYCPSLQAKFVPLSGRVATKHGFSATGLIGDELHEWPDGALYDVVHKSTGNRRQPIEVLITTAGIYGRGFGWEMHEKALRILEGDEDDPEFLPVIFAANDDDEWTDPATWAKANPNLGVSLKLEYLQSECRKAIGKPRAENDFKRFHLDLWTEQVTRWLPMADWKACTRDPADKMLWARLAEEMAGRRCRVGADLGSTRDVTAMVYAFEPLAPRDPVVLVCRFWLPEPRLREILESRDREVMLWRKWHELGAIKTTDGLITDHDVIVEDLENDAERFEIVDVSIDPHLGAQPAKLIAKAGFTVSMHRQGMLSMAAPTLAFERLAFGHRLEHGNHPVLKYMAEAAAVQTDPAGNKKPAKDKARRAIDGIVAGIMAVGRLDIEEEDDGVIETGLVA